MKVKPMKIAFQADPIENTQFWLTTHMMGREAQERGHEIWTFTPADVNTDMTNVWATKAKKIHYTKDEKNFYEITEERKLDLATMDVILIRQDPPYDMNYVSMTYMLEVLPEKVMIQAPTAFLRSFSEKMGMLFFPDLTPPTLISSNPDEMIAFTEKHGDSVLKVPYDRTSLGVIAIRQKDDNRRAIIEHMLIHAKTPLLVQKFMPEVYEGEKKVFIIDGEIMGAFGKKPSQGDFRTSTRTHGQFSPATLTAIETKRIKVVADFLKNMDCLFANIDMIGGYINEINVTSPGGCWFFNEHTGQKIEVTYMDALERKFKEYNEEAAD